MGYNIIDIVNKCIIIEENKRKIFKKIINEDSLNLIKSKLIRLRLIVLVKTFLKDIDRVIDYYEELKNRINISSIEEIDFRTYDKIAFLMNEYDNKIKYMDLDEISPKEYVDITLDLTKDKYALLIDIQGRLYNNTNDNKSSTYEVLTNLINHTDNHIKVIENIVSL